MNDDKGNIFGAEAVLLWADFCSDEPGAVRLDPVTPPSTRRTRSAFKSFLTGDRQ
jgi:hypothetical protein